jgi:hypothetical protein
MDAITLAEAERLAEQFSAEAREDLIGLWEIAKEVEERTGPGEVAREQTLELVRELLRRGLRAGEPPYSSGGFRPWPKQEPDAVIDRIRREWLALGRTPNIPDIVWFDLPS